MSAGIQNSLGRAAFGGDRGPGCNRGGGLMRWSFLESQEIERPGC